MNSTVVKQDVVVAAEFMGYTEHNHGSYRTYEMNGVHIYETVLQYDTKWEWLIPAWSKLYSLISMKQNRDNERMWNDAMNYVDQFGIAVNENNVTRAFEIFVSALKWYNNQGNTAK